MASKYSVFANVLVVLCSLFMRWALAAEQVDQHMICVLTPTYRRGDRSVDYLYDMWSRQTYMNKKLIVYRNAAEGENPAENEKVRQEWAGKRNARVVYMSTERPLNDKFTLGEKRNEMVKKADDEGCHIAVNFDDDDFYSKTYLQIVAAKFKDNARLAFLRLDPFPWLEILATGDCQKELTIADKETCWALYERKQNPKNPGTYGWMHAYRLAAFREVHTIWDQWKQAQTGLSKELARCFFIPSKAGNDGMAMPIGHSVEPFPQWHEIFGRKSFGEDLCPYVLLQQYNSPPQMDASNSFATLTSSDLESLTGGDESAAQLLRSFDDKPDEAKRKSDDEAWATNRFVDGPARYSYGTATDSGGEGTQPLALHITNDDNLSGKGQQSLRKAGMVRVFRETGIDMFQDIDLNIIQGLFPEEWFWLAKKHPNERQRNVFTAIRGLQAKPNRLHGHHSPAFAIATCLCIAVLMLAVIAVWQYHVRFRKPLLRLQRTSNITNIELPLAETS